MIEMLIVLLAIGIPVTIYNFLSGKNLILDYIHFFKIDSKSLKYWDRKCFENENKSDIIVSLTTIPSRFEYIYPTIKSLLAQSRCPKEIQIHIPEFSTRENVRYQIPEGLSQLKCVQVIWSKKDWGPATKFIPAILFNSLNQKILVVDDDNIYPSSLVQSFHEQSKKHEDKLLSSSGWRVPKDLVDKPTTLWSNITKTPPTPVTGRRVKGLYKTDIVQGYSGYLIKPIFFDIESLCDYSKSPEAARYVDDVWVSAHAKVEKYIFPCSRLCYSVFWKKKFYKKSSLAKINNWGKENYALRNNSIMIKYFENKWSDR